MDDMNAVELLIQMTEENQTRKIIEILKDNQAPPEVIEKIKALLK